MNQEIYQRLKPILIDRLNVRDDEISEEKSLTDLRADSMDAVDVMMEIEKKFDIVIPDDNMEKLVTVKHIVDYIETHTVRKYHPTFKSGKTRA